MNTKSIKKFISGLLAAAACITSLSFTAITGLSAKAEDGRNIADGVYYIRNLNSNKYLDISWCKTENGTEVIQFGFNGGLNQQFQVTRESDGYYTIKPKHCLSSAIDLRSASSANKNGTDAQLYKYGAAWNEQRFSIEQAVGGGFQIGTKCSGGQKVLEVTDSSMANNAIVQIWDYSTSRMNDNWVFEKVDTRKMSYFTLANLSGSDQNDANAIVSSFKRFGFKASPFNNPTTNEIASNSSADVLVFHGHGGIGFFAVSDEKDKNGPAKYRIYSNNAPSSSSNNYNIDNIIPKDNWKKASFVYFASCHSADTSSDHDKSLVDVAYESGAACVIGFKNNVAGGEDFLRFMLEAIEAEPDSTIKHAIARARITFMDRYSRSDYNPYTADDSPANKDNLVVKGNTSIKLSDFIH